MKLKTLDDEISSSNINSYYSFKFVKTWGMHTCLLPANGLSFCGNSMNPSSDIKSEESLLSPSSNSSVSINELLLFDLSLDIKVTGHETRRVLDFKS